MNPTDLDLSRAATVAALGGPGAALLAGVNQGDSQSDEMMIPRLVGQVYEAAPAIERGRLLEQLLRPLGLLSLAAIADGVFASPRIRAGWQDFHFLRDDMQRIDMSDVIALVEYVQQVSIDAVDSLAQTLAVSPMMAGSAAAVLVTLLLQRARRRREHTGDGRTVSPRRTLIAEQ